MSKPKNIKQVIRQETIDEMVEVLLKYAEELRNQRKNRTHERNIFLPNYMEEAAVKVAGAGASRKFIDSVVKRCLKGEWFWGSDGTQKLGFNLIQEVGCSINLVEKFATRLAANGSMYNFKVLLKILSREPSREEIITLVKNYTTGASEESNYEKELKELAKQNLPEEDLEKVTTMFKRHYEDMRLPV